MAEKVNRAEVLKKFMDFMDGFAPKFIADKKRHAEMAHKLENPTPVLVAGVLCFFRLNVIFCENIYRLLHTLL